VDFKELNDCIDYDVNTIPYTKQFYPCLRGKKYFSKLDNLWGFHQLILTPESQQYCAMTTPWGLYA
jgi:hypothetical protein